MEPVTLDALGITPYDSFDDGIEWPFRGVERGADGEPLGDMVCVTLTVPPLNLDSLRREEQKIATLQAKPDLVSMQDLADIVVRALGQNYKGVPRWLIEQSINIGNMAEMVRTVMDAAGLKRKEIEAGKAAAAKASTGTPSTAT